MADDATVSSIAALAEEAKGLAARGRVVLGITGPPGAGKSTVASAIVAALGDAAVLVPMDGFHLANAELDRLRRRDRKGAPDTFDAAGYVALLGRLRAPTSQPVYAPLFDRSIEEAIAGAIPVNPDVQLVVTEGNYLLLEDEPWSGVASLLDATWYVDLDDATRVDRLVRRHVAFGKSPAKAREWVLSSDEPNARLIASTRSRADRIVIV